MRKKLIFGIILAGMIFGVSACGKPEVQDALSSAPETLADVSGEPEEVTPALPEDYMTQEEAEDDSWKQEPEVDITGYYQMYYAGTDETVGTYVEIDDDHNYTQIQTYAYSFAQSDSGKTILSLSLQGAGEEMADAIQAYVVATDEGAVLDYNINEDQDVAENDEMKRNLIFKEGQNAIAEGKAFAGTYTIEQFGDAFSYVFHENGTMYSKSVESYEARGNILMMGEAKMSFEKTDEKITILTLDQEPMFDLIPCEKQDM